MSIPCTALKIAGVSADGEGERGYRGDREARGSQQEPDGVANVLEQGVHLP